MSGSYTRCDAHHISQGHPSLPSPRGRSLPGGVSPGFGGKVWLDARCLICPSLVSSVHIYTPYIGVRGRKVEVWGGMSAFADFVSVCEILGYYVQFCPIFCLLLLYVTHPSYGSSHTYPDLPKLGHSSRPVCPLLGGLSWFDRAGFKRVDWGCYYPPKNFFSIFPLCEIHHIITVCVTSRG